MKPHTATGLDWFYYLLLLPAESLPPPPALAEYLVKGSDLVPVLERELQLSLHAAFVGRAPSTTTTEGQVPPEQSVPTGSI